MPSAVDNTLALFRAAEEAGVAPGCPRQHHQPLRGFAAAILPRQGPRWSGHCASPACPTPSSAPTVLFGKEDILINNIAWLLRRFPVFGVFGSGHYRLQPIYVDDLAALAVSGRPNAAEPQSSTPSARRPSPSTSWSRLIGRDDRQPRAIVHLPPGLGSLSRIVGCSSTTWLSPATSRRPDGGSARLRRAPRRAAPA